MNYITLSEVKVSVRKRSIELLLALGILGLLISINIWVQSEIGFERGCWGFKGSQGAPLLNEGCNAQALRRIGSIWGIPLSVWGGLFYFTICSLTYSRAFLSKYYAHYLKECSEFLVLIAAVSSIYLIYYQLFVAHALCPPCLTSSGIIFCMLSIHLLGRFGEQSHDQNQLSYAIRLPFILFVGVLMLSLQQVLFFKGSGKSEVKITKSEFNTLLFQALPNLIGEQTLMQLASQNMRVEFVLSDWLSSDTPVLMGRRNQDAPNIITFLDPNCPHCPATFTDLIALSIEFGEQANFFVVPHPLWTFSIRQSAALEIAKKEGKYYDVWIQQLSKQRKGGWKDADIKTAFSALNMDIKDLESRLDATVPGIVERREKARKISINKVPTTYVDGRLANGYLGGAKGIAFLIREAILRRIQANAAVEANISKIESAK